MSDYSDIVTTRQADSSILYVLPNASVKVYGAGTANLVWSGQADVNGVFTVPDLATGKYDIKVATDAGEVLLRTIVFVTVEHVQARPETLVFRIDGTISGDVEESSNLEIFAPQQAGKIERVNFVFSHLSSDADCVIHILKGAVNDADALTIATDSVHSIAVAPGSEYYGYANSDQTEISVAANERVTIGVDYTAGTIEGLTVAAIFKPNES